MPPDPALTAEALALVQAQAAVREQIGSATKGSIVATLRAFLASGGRPGAGFFDSAAVTRLAKTLAATTRAGQRQTSTSTAAYWSRTTQLLTGRRPAGVRLVDTAAVRPVPLDAVYGRLADQYRWLQTSRGVDVTPPERLRFAVEAQTRKVARLAATLDHPDLGVVHGDVVTDHLGHPGEDISPAELARRIDVLIAAHPMPTAAPGQLGDDDLANRIVLRATGLADSLLSETLRMQIEAAAKADPKSITGYRRVVHPELGQTVCGLCIAAAGRTYHRGNLLPLHEMCRCTVVPLVGNQGGDLDVGTAIAEADLAALYDAAGGTTDQQALRRTRFRVVQHPEKGAIITADGSVLFLQRGGGGRQDGSAGARRSGPNVIRPQVDPAVVLQVADRSVADLERRQAAGEDVSAPLKYQKDLAERLRKAA